MLTKDYMIVFAIFLVAAWALGYLTGTMGGFIHLLLVVAIIVVLVRVIRGKKPV